MNYRIHGANSLTGHELSTTIQANSKKEAERIACERGILILKTDDEDGWKLPLRPGAHIGNTIPVEPRFKFLKREAFAFGFYAGWGMLFVYIAIRSIELAIRSAALAAEAAKQ